ncbi:hypothetical protein [Dyadobacter arcticus]|uniref:Lipoprotein n=1 Tax=Dyadobacter arcticus TaxID=1078754 RepID=A0ABX0UFT8_9BACT|nr:hypothetical protein [Dyadobacter arcticus]NIJ51873.1 hypothetical protein [Dyadobacter arcticus]
MKARNVISILTMLFISGCYGKIDPNVSTLYIEGGDRESERLEAIPKLYEHYVSSIKDKEAYEVISNGNGNFILNFTPSLKLLTLCGDPGSGWGKQFKDVDESVLQKLVQDGISFQDIESIGSIGSKFDSLLVRNKPRIEVKTNGEPSI